MDIKHYISNLIKSAIEAEFPAQSNEVAVEFSDVENHGDLSTSVCMQLAKLFKQSPMEVAKKLSYRLDEYISTDESANIIDRIETVAPGYINFYLPDSWLTKLLNEVNISDSYYGSSRFTKDFAFDNLYLNKKTLVEFTDPNPFKLIHIGHLMSNTIGESIARIIQFQGADLFRLNYEGDVGLHVAKTIWGFMQLMKLGGQSIDDLEKVALKDRVTYLGKSYAFGAERYESDPESAQEIKDLNILIYVVAQEYLGKKDGFEKQIDYKSFLNGEPKFDVELISEIYSKGREWSLAYFEEIYSILGTKFDDYYFESSVGEFGAKIVNEYLQKGIFEESDGAVVFRGEKYGLHTRVFMNSQKLPTYEAKDLGLAFMKYKDHKYDLSYIITANEIDEYFKVVLKALELINPELSSKTKHFGHGVMKLVGGKMSSRTGKVISAEELLDSLKGEIKKIMTKQDSKFTEKELDDISTKVAVSSLKFSILRKHIGDDVVYDPVKSLDFNGDTGPYLLYSYARANSVVEKSGLRSDLSKPDLYEGLSHENLHPKERALLVEMLKFPYIAFESAKFLSPHIVANYAINLSQKYNSFYNELPINNAQTKQEKEFRLALSISFMQVLRNSLYLLGISTVEKM